MRTRRRQCPARGSGLAAHDEEVRAGRTHTDTRTGDAEAASPKQARAVGQSAQRAEPGELRGGCQRPGRLLPAPLATRQEPRQRSADAASPGSLTRG